MMKVTAIKLLPAVFLAFAVSTAIADDSGYYAGVSVNRISADFRDTNDVDFGDSDNAGGIRGGYMFNDNIGVQFDYVDLGNYVSPGNTTANRIELDAEAFGVAVVVNYSFGDQFDLYGRIGAYQLDIRSESVVAGNSVSAADEDTQAYGAIGAEWDLGALNFFVELSKAETDIRDLTVDMATVGLKYEAGR